MTTKKTTPAVALNSLMLAALTLPGIQGTKAESPVASPETDFRYTAYDEGNTRYHVDIYLAQLKLRMAEKVDLEVNAIQEIQSGATPAGYVPAAFYAAGPVSTLVPAHTLASVHERRSEVNIKPRFFGEDYHVDVKAGISEESDYESKTIGVEYQKDLNKQNTALVLGYSYSNDSVKATTQANGLNLIRDTARHELNTHRFNASIKQDLSSTSLAIAGLEFITDRGYLNDPYKIALVWGNAVGLRSGAYYFLGGFGLPATVVLDRRPNSRGTLGGHVKFIQKIVPLDSAIHFGYRYVQNTWSIKSHTFNLDYHQQLGSSFEVVPSVRYYAQTEAYFYAMAFDIVGNAPFPAKRIFGNEPASTDYRLGRYGSITGELLIHYKFLKSQAAKLTAAFGVIDRRNKYYWGAKAYPANPDNNFKTLYGSVGLKYVF